MSPGVNDFLIAAGYSIGAAGAVWLLTMVPRRRSVAWLFASVVLTTTAAAIGAMVGGVRAMLLPMQEQWRVVAIAAAAGLLGAVAAGAAARKLIRDNETLRAAIAELGEGKIPESDGRVLTSELGRVRRQLGETARVLAESRERERALEASRRELVSWVSHDLRTPLAGLRAMAEALEDGVADDPEAYYKRICAEVDRLSGMVDDLFDLSRLQAGSYSRHNEPIALDDLVSDVLASLDPLATAEGIRLTGSVSGRAMVRGDGGELNRAVTNIVANAIRHTHTDGVVEVRVGVTEGRAEVLVYDECGGIPEADLGRVFEVGFRGEPSRTATGAGLGLAITRGIAEAHGGTVDVANTAAGCRFRLTLPLSD
jgi:signal transduction histidine kinase